MFTHEVTIKMTNFGCPRCKGAVKVTHVVLNPSSGVSYHGECCNRQLYWVPNNFFEYVVYSHTTVH